MPQLRVGLDYGHRQTQPRRLRINLGCMQLIHCSFPGCAFPSPQIRPVAEVQHQPATASVMAADVRAKRRFRQFPPGIASRSRQLRLAIGITATGEGLRLPHSGSGGSQRRTSGQTFGNQAIQLRIGEHTPPVLIRPVRRTDFVLSEATLSMQLTDFQQPALLLQTTRTGASRQTHSARTVARRPTQRPCQRRQATAMASGRGRCRPSHSACAAAPHRRPDTSVMAIASMRTSAQVRLVARKRPAIDGIQRASRTFFTCSKQRMAIM
jgi:hypothetical protein